MRAADDEFHGLEEHSPDRQGAAKHEGWQGAAVCPGKGEAFRPDGASQSASGEAACGWAEVGTDGATTFHAAYGEYLAQRQASTFRWSVASQWEFHQWARHGGKQPRSPDA